jgi:hypothetical protein
MMELIIHFFGTSRVRKVKKIKKEKAVNEWCISLCPR